jgi:serine/threonine protein kinase
VAKLVDLGGAPVNNAEREVIALLLRDLPVGWSVIPNASLPDLRTGHSYEYDAICVGPHVVYVVEVKGWRGRVRQLGQADWQLEGGRVERNPLNLTDQKARVLASRLKASVPGPPYVQACLASGSDDTVFEVLGLDARRCLQPCELVPYLLDPARTGRPVTDHRAQHEAIVRAITGSLQARRSVGRRYGSWLATSLQERDEEHAVWLGRHALLDDGRVARIRAWYLSDYRYTPEGRAAEQARRRRSADALARVGDHPRIARLLDFGDMEGEFYEVTEWSAEGTLQTALLRGGLTRLDTDRKVRIVRDIAEGLAAAAAQGVFHRSLSPEAVLLDAEGRARITAFDLAYIENAPGTVYGAAPPPHLQFLAPELRNPKDYEVFDSSDLYALAKMSRILFADSLPPGVRALLGRCAADDPSARPQNPGAFLRELDALGAPPAPPPPTDRVGPGDTLDGVNVVLGELGRGAGATVYRVANEPLGRELAMKLVTGAPDGYDATAEFRLLRSVESPHVPRVHWLGRLTRPGGGHSPYLLLDLVEGERLSDVIARGPLPVDRALDLGADLLAALDALHLAGAGGVLHRDVKPENIVVGPGGAVLVDFGAARAGTDGGNAIASTMRVSPPDLAETGWQPQADVFAAACVIYEMLAGRPPWADAPAASVIPVGLDALRSDVPSRVAAILTTALRPRAAERFATATLLREALAGARPVPTAGVGTRTSLSFAVEEAGSALWSAGRVQDLTRHPDLAVPLAEILRSCVVPPADDSAEAARDALLATEARALAFEAPLPEAMGSVYDAFVAGLLPAPMEAGVHEEPRAARQAPQRTLGFDALHFTEWAVIAEALRSLGRSFQVFAWVPPPPAGIAAAFAGDISGAACSLPRGDRAAVELGALLVQRRRLVEDALLSFLAEPGPASIGASDGLIYLGHGLRRDVGEGLGDRADGARAAWVAAFPTGRAGPVGGPLPSRLACPTRTAGALRHPVGRLAWPDAPGTPWLQAGGFSLPERVQLLFSVEA